MRKFWIVLLAAGLFMAFTMPAIAAVGGVDVKFSGTLRMRGWYDDNVQLFKDTSLAVPGTKSSQAFVDNRLRMVTEFKVAEGLALVTRLDALERKWGQTLNNNSNYVAFPATGLNTPAANFNDSISIERIYVDFTTGIGRFLVGYQENLVWGTGFGDSASSTAGIKYLVPFGPATLIAFWEKRSEGMYPNASVATTTPTVTHATYLTGIMDIDVDVYNLGFLYKFTGGDAGLMMQYGVNNAYSKWDGNVNANPYKRTIWIANPYVKYKAGPVYVEAEGAYMGGKWAEYDRAFTTVATRPDVDLAAWGIYAKAEVDVKPAYVGLKFVYSTGDKPDTLDKKEGSVMTDLTLGQAGHDFALMYGNYEYYNQITGAAKGWIPKNAPASLSNPSTPRADINYGIDNAVAIQVYGGFKPTPKLDVKVAYSYMTVQEKPAANWVSDKIGSEFDITASYKIFDNLTYTVGAGYFWTGDYFKGTSDANMVDNDYLVMHQLQLAF